MPPSPSTHGGHFPGDCLAEPSALGGRGFPTLVPEIWWPTPLGAGIRGSNGGSSDPFSALPRQAGPFRGWGSLNGGNADMCEEPEGPADRAASPAASRLLSARALAVLAPWPAAGSTLAFLQLLLGPPNAAFP